MYLTYYILQSLLTSFISLREDDDPRVEGELERLINETEWKD